MGPRRRRRTALRRGEIYDAGHPDGRRPAVIVTRDVAIPLLTNVTVAFLTRTVRGVPTEVGVGPEQGMKEESVVNCDNLFTLPKRALGLRRGALDFKTLDRLDVALRVALDLN